MDMEGGGRMKECIGCILLIPLAVPAILFLLGFSDSSLKAASSWEEQWNRTVEAAKKEGQLNAYGLPDITHPAILEAFNKRYSGIKVVTVMGHTEVIQRIVAERRAGKYVADVFSSGPAILRQAYSAKFLQPISSILMLPDVTDTTKWYGGKHLWSDPEEKYLLIFEGTPSSASMAYNTKRLPNPGEIQSYWDVLRPKWKGNIGFFNDGEGATVPTPILALYYNPEVGPDFLKKLFEEMDLTLSRDRRQATDWLGRGKYTLCFLCRGIEEAQKMGLPVETIHGDQIKEAGALGSGNSSTLGFFDKAPHPNAAIVFINWFLSREGQMTWQKVLNTIVVNGSDSMRIDIPKDDVLPGYRRAEGRRYPMLGFLAPQPVRKFYWELVAKAGLEKSKR
jgi:ABC-type Fe3+ transport system substrate-binding protein